ncbi:MULTISPECIES: P-type conjugative transfer protein TrbJ [Hyphomonas]|jgi:P-type conjugative transfer protein TrbJ|uniref:Conjugal transfer protein TrbJ n=1 Tax=Hyphomonas chukchiensis TaxID=1280947 RepID=A0A062U9A9_9PROT|nr:MULTISPECIES: P-type conjugative transfer protein TrbJ [Hyphomonas]KCZ56956.1 hypothetical protein HY30_17860 [Hyphomonas chukchiensis]MAN89308.1 P-type conjugative transfer protein TrbJ [Hyphomonadaceae bacterium]MBG53640.1 P-type conjugative transfer protein TrbJ [Rhodobiaceae bacterium]HAQ76213.1 P-type conjugative transfer protein TrbJ [Hyphomonas sp.]|tara:strand:- start:16105 stop:16824 length:720 start_codon:yes stop_codon:yes gene_type:complete
MRRRIIAALLLAAAPMTIAPPAHAIFGIGDIVIDPSNLAQNILTAANTLEQINNQVKQLQNEADMLINQATNLVRTGYNPQAEINRLLNEISVLMDRARSISYVVSETDRLFQENFPEDYSAWSRTQMATAAEMQWVSARSAFNDTLLVQSQIVQTLKADTSSLDAMLAETAIAEGNLSVSQTGNQIAALGVKQTMQMQEMMAAQYRADALARARDLQIEREGREKLARFVGGASAYTR